jgi:hypothetical protein
VVATVWVVAKVAAYFLAVGISLNLLVAGAGWKNLTTKLQCQDAGGTSM